MKETHQVTDGLFSLKCDLMARHTTATLYLKNRTNIENIQLMLEHTSLSTTQKYLQLTDEEVAKDLLRANW
ncbi:MAG: tyrosine-type recombinase/integrase [Thermotogae bacterium]|nr:tyrosine-type recombinase/integrase [Thermotogota bacterium]